MSRPPIVVLVLFILALLSGCHADPEGRTVTVSWQHSQDSEQFNRCEGCQMHESSITLEAYEREIQHRKTTLKRLVALRLELELREKICNARGMRELEHLGGVINGFFEPLRIKPQPAPPLAFILWWWTGFGPFGPLN